MMIKQNSRPVRIDAEMDELIKEIAKKNDLTRRQASKELAKQIKQMNIQGKKIRREIKF